MPKGPLSPEKKVEIFEALEGTHDGNLSCAKQEQFSFDHVQSNVVDCYRIIHIEEKEVQSGH